MIIVCKKSTGNDFMDEKFVKVGAPSMASSVSCSVLSGSGTPFPVTISDDSNNDAGDEDVMGVFYRYQGEEQHRHRHHGHRKYGRLLAYL